MNLVYNKIAKSLTWLETKLKELDNNKKISLYLIIKYKL